MDLETARSPASPAFTLVVEDHCLVRNLVVQLLEAAGHHPLAVSDADQALALWLKFPHRFKLVVTDILMPSSLDGLTLGRLIQTHQPDLPVLYMSGSESPDRTAALIQGQNFLRKPFGPGEFLSAIDRLLETRPSPPALPAYLGELATPARG
jgi:CheY-like chemotaxis protein